MESVTKEEPKGLTRPDFKRSIFLGIQGEENMKKALDLMVQAFPDQHVHIFDKQLYGQVTELIIKKHVEWTDRQGILQYTSKPENIQQALLASLKIKEAVGPGWFGLKELVDNTNFTYDQAKSVLELQFAFGFLAKDESSSRTTYRVVNSLKDRIAYIETVRNGLQGELEEIELLLQDMNAEAIKAVSDGGGQG